MYAFVYYTVTFKPLLTRESQNEERPKFGGTYPRETILWNSRLQLVNVTHHVYYYILKQHHTLKPIQTEARPCAKASQKQRVWYN